MMQHNTSMNTISYAEKKPCLTLKLIERSYVRQDYFTAGEILNKIETLSEAHASMNELYLVSFQQEKVASILRTVKNKFVGVRAVTMRGCSLCSETIIIIRELIKNRGLKCLTLHDCTFAPAPVPELTQSNSSLTYFRLQNCHFNHNNSDWVRYLTTNHSLETFTLKNCHFKDDAVAAILNSINKSALTKLNLRSVKLDDSTTKAIINCIDNSLLTNLKLMNCDFVQNSFAVIMESIQKSTIQCLDLAETHFNHITYPTESVCAFTSLCACIENSQISTLKLNCCSISNQNLMLIVESTKRSNTFKNISLGRGSFGGETAEIIVDLLKNPKIETIDLSSCILSANTIEQIIAAVKCSSLLVLKLNNNLSVDNINANIAAICDLLENHGLQELWLNNNSIKDAALLSMLPSIKKSSLTKFEFESKRFCFVAIAPEIKTEIKNALKEQKKLTRRFKKTKSAK